MDFSFPSDKYKLVILSHYWLMGLPQSRIYRNATGFILSVDHLVLLYLVLILRN